MFFFAKKNQKTFASLDPSVSAAAAKLIKVFCFFFAKKKNLLSYLLYLSLGIVVLAPVLDMQVVGLGDTLNHLARMHILDSIAQSPALQKYYEVHWSAIPYLAMDAVVPPLLRIMPIYLAGKLFVCACILLPVAGCACVRWAAVGRIGLAPAVAFLISTNYLLALGFLNFLFASGLALLLFAGWIAARGWPRWRRAAVFAGPVLLLYFAHAFACAAYCLCVAGFEIGQAARARFRPLRFFAANAAAAFAQAVPALVFAATLNVSAGYVGALNTEYGTPGEKLMALLSPMLFLQDRTHALVIVASLCLLALFARTLRLLPMIWPAALALALASCVVPHVVASTWGTDLRFPFITLLLLAASATTSARGPQWRAGFIAAMLLLTCAKSADAWGVLRKLDGQIAEARRLVALMPRGARLLIVCPAGHGTGHEQLAMSTIWHMPMVAVIDRDAFVPYLFSGLTTVRVRDAYTLASTPNGLPLTPAQLWEGMDQAPHVQGDGLGARLYQFGWPQNFDFVLVERFGVDPGALPANLVMVGQGMDMDLYRITPSPDGKT